MSGVVFLICVPTENYEKCLLTKVKKKVTIELPRYNVHSNSDEYMINNLDDDFLPICYSTESGGDIRKREIHYMEKDLREILKQLNITNATWCKNDEDNYLQVIFSMESSDRCEEIIEVLKENQIGHRLNSSVSVVPCTLQYHGQEADDIGPDSKYLNEGVNEEINDKNSGWNRFLTSVRARLKVAQVVENVKVHATLTFDFISLILISTCRYSASESIKIAKGYWKNMEYYRTNFIMCAIGLVENSNVYLLSSMLICPMMGPVMAGTFGSVIEHRRLLKIGVQNELIGLGIATIIGFCYGTLICIITDKYGNQTWPTYEMLSRGELRSLWVGCLIALLSGAAVALGILSDNIASLVGVAISTSLTPPAVNAGLLWSLASVYYIKGNETTRYNTLTQTNYYSKNYARELLTLGAVSMCLTFVNIVCIYVAGILVFKIKEVAPMSSKDHARRRFWKHDIKIARDYNKTLQNEEAGCMITKLSEEIAQYHKSRFNNEQFCHSTNLARDQFKININRSEYTWSPCMNVSKKTKEINELYENLMKCKPNTSRLLTFAESKLRPQHRRLSQIFDHDNLNNLEESHKEKGPSIVELSCETNEVNSIGKQFSSGKKKFIVTPCETDPLKS